MSVSVLNGIILYGDYEILYKKIIIQIWGKEKIPWKECIVKKAYKFLLELFTFWCLCAKIKVAFKEKRSAFQ